MLDNTPQLKKPLILDERLSGWSLWNIGKTLIATIGTIAAGAVGISLLSNLWTEQSENNAIHLDDSLSLDLRSSEQLLNADHIATQIIAEPVVDKNHVAQSANPMRRKLLSTDANITVINPIPPQQVEATIEWVYPLGDVFAGDVQGIGMDYSGNNPQPTWLTLDAIVGNYDTPGNAKAVQVIASIAYVADFTSGLQIINVTNPASPTWLSSYNTPGEAYDVQVIGGIAYVADGNSGLQILNVSNPLSPGFLGTYDTPFTANDVQVIGDIAYVSDESSLQILNVSNPTHPSFLSSYNMPGAFSAQIIGNLAYVADYDLGLQILNVSNPINVTWIGSYNTPGYAQASQIVGNLAYIADYASGLQILNVTIPANITLLGSYNTPGYAYAIQVIGSTVYVADDISGLDAIDVGSPTSPKLLSIYDTPGKAYAIHVGSNIIYVADGTSGLQLVDIKKPSFDGTPTASRSGQQYTVQIFAWDSLLHRSNTTVKLTVNQKIKRTSGSLDNQSLFPGQTKTIALNTNGLFLDPDGFFLTLDVTVNQLIPIWLSTKLKPALLGNYDTPGAASGLLVLGNIAYVADYFSLQVINVLDFANPTGLGTHSIPGRALAIQVIGNIAYVAAYDAGLQILSVANPAMPTLSGSYDTPGYAFGIQVIDNTAYVADFTFGLQILNVTILANTTLLGNFRTPSFANAVQVIGSVAYVADIYSGLQIINVINSTKPTFLGGYSCEAYGLQIIGNFAYVASYDTGLQIVNVANSTRPILVGSYDTTGLSYDVNVVGNTAFVADYTSGLQIIDLRNPGSPVFMANYDTPGFAVDIQVIGSVAFVADWDAGIQIIDLSQWELTLSPTAADLGNHEIIVTATDSLGATTSISFTLRVEGPPIFNGTLLNQTNFVGSPYNYFIPAGLVSDPNNDPIEYNAYLLGGGLLPSWLTFNPVSATFAGTPDVAGSYVIEVSATDNIAGTAVSRFSLAVTYTLQLTGEISSPPNWREGRGFSYTIPSKIFTDLNGNTLLFSVSLDNQIPLPAWMTFDPTALTLSGVPPVGAANQYVVAVTVTDAKTGASNTQRFTLQVTVNQAPVLTNPVAAQLASVGSEFIFVLPPNTFIDPNGDALNYTAKQLPGWLRFFSNTRTFSGKPDHSDTDTFSNRLNDIKVTATDGQLETDMDFTIGVQGDNNWNLLFKIGSPIIGVLSFMLTAYKWRRLVLNQIKSRFQAPGEIIEVGEMGTLISLNCDAEQIHAVRAKLIRDPAETYWEKLSRPITGSKQPFFGAELPHWLRYSRKDNALLVINNGPTEDDTGEYIIEVVNSGNVLLRRFTLTVLNENPALGKLPKFIEETPRDYLNPNADHDLEMDLDLGSRRDSSILLEDMPAVMDLTPSAITDNRLKTLEEKDPKKAIVIAAQRTSSSSSTSTTSSSDSSSSIIIPTAKESAAPLLRK